MFASVIALQTGRKFGFLLFVRGNDPHPHIHFLFHFFHPFTITARAKQMLLVKAVKLNLAEIKEKKGARAYAPL